VVVMRTESDRLQGDGYGWPDFAWGGKPTN